MTLGISMLKNIFPLHTKMWDYYLEQPNVYTEYHNVYVFSPKVLLMLTNKIMLTISERDTLRARRRILPTRPIYAISMKLVT